MKKYLPLLATIVVLGAGFYFSERQFLSYSPTPAPSPSAVSAPASSTPEASSARVGGAPLTLAALKSSPEEVHIAAFKIGDNSYTVVLSPGETVMDAMHALESSGRLTFTGKEYPSMGFFVESINGRKNADGYYWFLYVNGTSSATGASQTTLKAGDAVEWRYEKN